MSEQVNEPSPRETALVQQRAGVLAPIDPAVFDGIGHEREPHFWDYWHVLVSRRWTIISCFVVATIVATIWTFTTPPVYTAGATLRIEKDQPRIVKFEEVVKEDSQQDYYQTQYKILQSRSLANRVIGMLALDQHPEFQAPERERRWLDRLEDWARESLVRWMPVPPPPAPEAAEDLPLSSPLTNAYLQRLSVEPVRGSRLVKVAFTSHYPEIAARVSNATADAFIAQQLDQRVEATRYATQFLARQLDEARDKLGDAESKLSRFLEVNDILFIAGDKGGQQQDLVTQQLGILSDALIKARAERVVKQSVMAQARVQNIDSLPAVLRSAVITKLKEDLAEQEVEYRRLAQVFKPDYPRMQQLAEKIAEGRRQLAAEIAREVRALDTDYRVAARYEREIEGVLAQHRALARGLNARMADYNLLRRDVDTSRELYSSLLGRLRETQISAALLTSNISIVDRAEIPASPSKPRRGLNLMVACVLGIMGGIGLAFVREYLDTSIKDAREVENVLRVPTLALVPSRDGAGQSRQRRRELAQGNVIEEPFALVSHVEAGSIFAEAFRNLRTSLLYSTPEHPPKTLMITSLQPEDGKTSLTANLGVTLAQLGAGEILLIDADMRRPNLHEVFGVPQTPGLSTFLTGQAQLRDVVMPTRVPELFVLPSGRVPLNPAELLGSARLRQALEALTQRFAYVIFDTCPLFGVSDSLILATEVQGVVLVLRQGRTSRDAAQRAIRNLLSVRAKLLGVVLNDVDLSASRYYTYYGYATYGNGAGDRNVPA